MRSITRVFAAFTLSACLFLGAKRTSYADLVVTSDGVAASLVLLVTNLEMASVLVQRRPPIISDSSLPEFSQR